ncbi:unnamed protein product [Blepharisma stoltei]|uniref:THIF-type NAD/FAD binding fold domain-containing protein n=1 Tax=Blepharisma stoltei TaxID=1481888 RepID=A0AAU9JGN5_9CILI|nr:unnamed protein product [Blepharisma stoltei]
MGLLKEIIMFLIGIGMGSYVVKLLLMKKKKQKSFPLKDQLVRNHQFFKEGQDKIQSSFVVVLGLGGIGSHCVITLARSGVKKVRIIDNSVLTAGALNGHGVAKTRDIGKHKTDVLKAHIGKIIPQCEIEIQKAYFSLENASSLLAGNPDYVVDCIGNVSCKADLIQYCLQNQINIITTASAAGKIDPTRVEVADISNTKNCDTVRKLRKTLKKRGIAEGVQVVYLAETPRYLLLDPQNPIKQMPIPAIGTLTSITGNSVASYVLSKLGGVSFEPFIRDNYRKTSFLRLVRHLELLEKNHFHSELEMDIEEIEQVVRTLWNLRSAYSNSKKSIEAVRFDLTQPASVSNLILLTDEELIMHLDGRLEWSQEQISLIKQNLMKLG